MFKAVYLYIREFLLVHISYLLTARFTNRRSHLHLSSVSILYKLYLRNFSQLEIAEEQLEGDQNSHEENVAVAHFYGLHSVTAEYEMRF